MTALEKRIIRQTLAIIWIATGVISLGIYPVEESLKLLARVGIEGKMALLTLYGEALLDIVIGLLTLIAPGWRLWQLQAAIIIGYTIVISIFLPEFWFHPFGPLLKNLPIFTLLWLLYRHEGTST